MKLYIFRRTKEAIAIEDITLDKVDQKGPIKPAIGSLSRAKEMNSHYNFNHPKPNLN